MKYNNKFCNLLLLRFALTSIIFTATLTSCSKDDGSNQSPAAFTLIAVGDGAISVEVRPTFSWNASINPDGGPISYKLIIDTKSNPTTVVADNISSTTFSLQERLPFIEHLFWKVIATDNAGNATTSNTFSFTTRNLKFPLTAVTSNPGFSPRRGHSSIVFDNKIWVIGGTDGGAKNDVWSSPDGVTWTLVTASAGFSVRIYHTSVVFNNKIWVIGGNNNGTKKNDVWSSPDGATWTLVTATAPFSSRSGHTSVVFDNKIWVIAGSGFTSISRTNDVWSSPDGASWTPVASSTGFSARHGHTSIVFDNKMWVIAGRDQNTKSDVWSSTNGLDWTSVILSEPFKATYMHTSVVFDNKIWIIAGTGLASFNDAFGSSDGAVWNPVTATSNTPLWRRHSHTSVVFGDKIWVIAGFEIGGVGHTNDIWTLD